MSETVNLDRLRGEALNRIERAEKNFRLAIIGAALVEALLLGAFFLAADFSNRDHLLLLIAMVTIYSVVGAGLVALGAHDNRNTRLILKAIDLLDRR